MTSKLQAWTALALAILAAASPVRGQAPGAQIRVETTPEGAMVSCDGILRDAAPVTLKGLSAGDHLIVAQKAGFQEVRRTVRVAPGETAAVALALPIMTGLFVIHSTPSGAEIEISGAHRGPTPLLVTDLPVGRYRVKASAVGYIPREVDIEVKDRIPFKVPIELVSDSAKLVISSTPAGASVVLNGLSKGVTPCTVDRVSSGNNRLVVTLQDYAPFQQDLRLEAGSEQKIDIELKPLPGALSILSTPAGAKVYMDDALRGQTPLVLDTVAAGSHTVRLELDTYETQTRTIELAKSQTKAEEFQLVRNSGSLVVVTDPAGVTVSLDGEAKGTTATGGERQPSAPLRIDPVSTGQHKVLLARKGYFTVEKIVTVERGQTVPVRESMKRKFVPDTIVRVKSGPGDAVTGCLSRKLVNGDVEIETKIGIFKTIKADDIVSVSPLVADDK